AFEAPLAAQALARTGRYAAILALGAVIRGATPHFDYVCDAAAAGLLRVGLATGFPGAFGIPASDTLAHGERRACGCGGAKGQEAADAAVAMVTLLATASAPARPTGFRAP